MSLTHSTDAKKAAADGVVDLIDVGEDNGVLELLKAADVLVASCDCADPAFGAANASGIATADTISDGTAVAAGDIIKFQLKDSDDNVIFSGTVGIKYAVTACSQENRTFTVAEDLSAILTRGDRFRVTGSTGNDGVYTVISAVYGATTVITVVESLASAVADGHVNPYDLTMDNPNGVVIGQTISITSLTYQGEAS
jgi:hypothetical protein